MKHLKFPVLQRLFLFTILTTVMLSNPNILNQRTGCQPKIATTLMNNKSFTSAKKAL